jgi:hypothetical protein
MAQQQVLAMQREQILQAQQLLLLQQRYWEKLFRTTVEMSEPELRATLTHKAPDRRFLATYMVGERLLEWPEELIPRLEDDIESVRQAARRSLIILSFLALNPEEAQQIRSPQRTVAARPLSELQPPVDFGPNPRANRTARAEAAKQWRQWWADRAPKSSGPGSELATTKKPGRKKESERLADALLESSPGSRQDLIAKYRDEKGVPYTEALAIASARASGEVRQQLRDALGERMKRMTDRELGEYLTDTDAEIRRTAALALASQKSTGHITRMIDMLLDAQPSVQQAAHAALCYLSREDFGPRVNATETEKQEAAGRWRQWWAEKKPAD